MNIQEKLQETVDYITERTEDVGSTILSVCKDSHYGWDKDEWTHRNTIINALKTKGYNVSQETNHGVLDITIYKHVELV